MQEEADTRLLLHASYVVQEGSGAVVIVANDNGVLVLALVHHYAIKGQHNRCLSCWSVKR